MTNEVKSNFNDFLSKLGEAPIRPIASDTPTDVLEIEITELEDKIGLPHELPSEKEAENENN